jgi:hypothetical protein
VVDESLAQELAETASPQNPQGSLLAHFQAPLTAGEDVYIEVKSGPYTSCQPAGSGATFPCGPDAWGTQTWSEHHLRWASGALTPVATLPSDWKPPPNRGTAATNPTTFFGWEPLFHAALSGSSVWVPGSGGSVLQYDRATDALIAKRDPFSGDPNTYVTSPLTATPQGEVLYTVMTLDPANPWGVDAQGYLVKVTAAGVATKVLWTTLVPGAPAATALCETSYAGNNNTRPLPVRDPSTGGFLPAPTIPCGSQRPGVNAAPAVGVDGTIFVVGRAHFAPRTSYVIAVNPTDLSPKWATSLRDYLNDGCGFAVPRDGQNGRCYPDAPFGVDPVTGAKPAGMVSDQGTSSPVALPDGSVLYGALTLYNGYRGHLFKIPAAGGVLATYDFGWDITPAWFPHDGTYSIVLKDNVYFAGQYFLTQLDANLRQQWRFQSPTNTEWCVNAVAVDKDGVVYANSEDGSLYTINPGGTQKGKVVLGLALGAAYTPITLDAKGRIYAQNAGKLYAFGGP